MAEVFDRLALCGNRATSMIHLPLADLSHRMRDVAVGSPSRGTREASCS